ncbi:MAG: PorV/PorQ family protein [Elusimicrobia bacterium]|nr:PorV/PorQ family protein [Elusimicrobiota bacterium]
MRLFKGEVIFMKKTSKFQVPSSKSKALCVEVLFLAASCILRPATSFASGVGTSGGQFLRVPVGARAAAMGGAFSALADDVTAIYWNPAGLAQLQKREVSLSYNSYFADTSGQFLGYGQGNFGVSINMLGVADIEKRSATGGDADTPDLGTFSAKDMAGSVAWAKTMGRMNIGIAAKYISSDLGDLSATSFAADLGAIMSLGEAGAIMGGSLQGSLALLNLGGELKFDQEGDPLPLDIKPGLAWKGKAAGRTLNAVLDADFLINDQVNLVQLGLEYWLIEQMGFRAGYQAGRGSGTGGFAAGLGFKHAGLGVDYAFVPFGDLGDTHRVSLSLRF